MFRIGGWSVRTGLDLANLSPRLLVGMAQLGLCFLASVHYVSDVAVPLDGAQQHRVAVARVGAKVLAAPLGWQRALGHAVIEPLFKSLAIVDVRPGHDDRQRDATPVNQQMTCAPSFSPDPSDSTRRVLEPLAP